MSDMKVVAKDNGDLLSYIENGPPSVVEPVAPSTKESAGIGSADAKLRLAEAEAALEKAAKELAEAQAMADESEAGLAGAREASRVEGAELAKVEVELEQCQQDKETAAARAKAAAEGTREAAAALERASQRELEAAQVLSAAEGALASARELAQTQSVAKQLTEATVLQAEAKVVEASVALDAALDAHRGVAREEAEARALADLFAKILADKNQREYEMKTVAQKVGLATYICQT